MQLAKIYMKSGNVIEIECENFEVITSGESIENIEFKKVISNEKPMFLDFKNIEYISTQKIEDVK